MKHKTAQGLVGLACVFVVIVGISTCSDKPQTRAAEPQPAAESTVATAPVPAQAESVEPPDAPMTLADAVSTALPLMRDTANETSEGTATLAFWADDNLTWRDLQSLPKTSAGLVLKDSVKERGKRVCETGRVIEITSASIPARNIYEGEISDDRTLLRFTAVKSTGELIEGSTATFCGIATGRFDYSNSGAGMSHAIAAVGMFKLPENLK